MSKVVMVSLIGLLIVCFMGAIVGLLIAVVVWHMFYNNLDFDFEDSEQELIENNNETE